MSVVSDLQRTVDNYRNMRTIPAYLSAAFVALSLYQFGGIDPIVVKWFGGYTLETSHAVLGSLGTWAFAFMSSRTKEFQSYDPWEQAVIGLGPVLIVGYEYFSEVNDILLELGDPLGYQVAFMMTIISWGVAVR
jgi:hypothetical protein